jgi:hypothetical protein
MGVELPRVRGEAKTEPSIISDRLRLSANWTQKFRSSRSLANKWSATRNAVLLIMRYHNTTKTLETYTLKKVPQTNLVFDIKKLNRWKIHTETKPRDNDTDYQIHKQAKFDDAFGIVISWK